MPPTNATENDRSAATLGSLFLENMVYRTEIDAKPCFVLMPFRDPFDGYYEHIIKKAVRIAGFGTIERRRDFRHKVDHS